ncbi:hypothetical protein [Geminicoccus harenae]|uniref:hypothetical protein n=3 Tax=Geminicoccus harenae TaxID=2498453 RepID=UPI001C9827F7|nr:hypothetical protein [Geminicoccus harenae]
MLRNLMFGAAAIALAALSTPASAQLAAGDVEIEGPMSHVEVFAAPKTDSTVLGPRTYIGYINLMGVTVKVLQTALIHTPTNTTTATLKDFALTSPKLPGRTTGGFIGGTAIIVGESINGQVYASDVFSDLFEHVVVGEATAPVIVNDQVSRATINGMIIRPSTDKRMPAGAPINGLGLKIDADAIDTGTLVAAEGYFSPSQNTLYYHTLEADSARLLRPEATQIGVLRADCRVRGGGRDEIQVRGGVANPADGLVIISIPSPTPNNPNRFVQVGTVQAVPDPATSNPVQGQFDADFRNLTIASGVCPTLVRARVNGTGADGSIVSATVTADMEGR